MIQFYTLSWPDCRAAFALPRQAERDATRKEYGMQKKLTATQRLSRREAFRLVGAAGAVALVGREIAGRPCAAQGTVSCVVTPALTEGPFFVDEKLNRSDIRVDPTDNSVRPGVPLRLKLTVQRVDSTTCTPLTGATVDVWHCDALGAYSDVSGMGNGSTVGKKFLRGYQVTDQNGLVQFTTVYPGWYRGRAVHIHFKVRMNSGSQAYEFTSQFFFNEAITDAVYTQAPYNTKGSPDTRNSTDNIFQQPVSGSTGTKSGDLLMLQTTKAENDADGYVGTLGIGLKLA
jgi:protocatechuate 3,4-dioxygenase beta subunit